MANPLIFVEFVGKLRIIGKAPLTLGGPMYLSVCHEAHIYIKGWLPSHINVAVTANEMRAGLSVSVCRHWHQTLCKPLQSETLWW